MGLKIYDTLAKTKRDFVPLHPGKVGMYVCGVTVYDYCHIGHARVYVAFDVIARYLRHSGYELRYVRNFTDVDDKIIRRAHETDQTCTELTDTYIQAFRDDMGALGVGAADVEPRVTEHIPQIVAFVQRIIDAGHGYVVDGDVYYDIDSLPAYGKLSGRDLRQLIAGASGRVDATKALRNPLDFALWKSAKPGEPAWPSPWGPGRPGWHIECSTMSAEHLGPTFDIHGGGQDLIFPHHENEIAQSEGAHSQEMARYWVHNGFVNCPVYVYFADPADPTQRYAHTEVEAVESQFFHRASGRRLNPVLVERDAVRIDESEGKRTACHCQIPGLELKLEQKMSKSLGNCYTVRDVLVEHHPEAVRYFLLTTHYRAPLNFSLEALDEATGRVEYLYETLDKIDRKLETLKPRPGEQPVEPERIARIASGFSEAMDDDFNTPRVLAVVADALRLANEVLESTVKAGKAATLQRLRAELGPVLHTLGVGERPPARVLGEIGERKIRRLGIDRAAVEALIAARTEARKQKDFARADAIRHQLLDQRIVLMDSPQGTAWKVQ